MNWGNMEKESSDMARMKRKKIEVGRYGREKVEDGRIDFNLFIFIFFIYM